jgi:hypothetical protein
MSQQKPTAGDALEIWIIVDLSHLSDLFLLWIYPTPLDIPSHFGAIHSGGVHNIERGADHCFCRSIVTLSHLDCDVWSGSRRRNLDRIFEFFCAL